MGNIFTKRNICKISISLLGFSFLLIFSLSYAQTAHAQFDFGNFNIWNLGAKIIISPTPGGGLGYDFIEGIGGAQCLQDHFALSAISVGNAIQYDMSRQMDELESDFQSLGFDSLAVESAIVPPENLSTDFQVMSMALDYVLDPLAAVAPTAELSAEPLKDISPDSY